MIYTLESEGLSVDLEVIKSRVSTASLDGNLSLISVSKGVDHPKLTSRS